MKRTMDIALSAFGLAVLSPALLAVALAIKWEDKGPVFYRGERVGLRGRRFRIFKFRSMVTDAERLGGPSTSDDDPRITRVGRVIRGYKLDELPQLINVLLGDMSLVGPRPEVPVEVETYSDEEKRVLSVRPGITDWASLRFHNEGEILKGCPDPHQAYRERIRPEKMRLALAYVDRRGALTDARIIVSTLATLLRTRMKET